MKLRRKRKKSDEPDIDTLEIVEVHERSELELRISSFDEASKSLKIAKKKSVDAERNWKIEKDRMTKEIEERGRKYRKLKKKQKKLLKNNPGLAD